MNETLEQIALRVASTIAAPWISDESIIRFSSRLVAELAKQQEPKAYWHETDNGLHCVNTMPPSGQVGWTTTPLYTAPIPTPEEVKDAARYRNIKPIIDQFPELNPNRRMPDYLYEQLSAAIETLTGEVMK